MAEIYDVGDEVICIDDKKGINYNSGIIPQWPVKDNKYIVRSFANNDGIVEGVRLAEIVNPEQYVPLLNDFQEPAFATWRFVKLRTAYQIREESETIKESIDESVEVI